MSEFVVYTVPGSPYALAVLATLEEKRLDYRLSPLAPAGIKSEPHLSRHPFGRMPAASMMASGSTRHRRSCATSTGYFRGHR